MYALATSLKDRNYRNQRPLIVRREIKLVDNRSGAGRTDVACSSAADVKWGKMRWESKIPGIVRWELRICGATPKMLRGLVAGSDQATTLRL